MKNSYQDQMDGLRLSPEGKGRLIAALASEGKQAGPRPRRVLRLGLLMAVAAALLTAAAGATLLVAPVLRDYYGGGGYDQSAGALGHSVTRGGWTMTLTDCVGDDNYLYLGLSLTAPRGTVLNAGKEESYYLEHEVFQFDGMGRQAMAWVLRQVPDADPADHQLRFVLWIEARSDTGSLNGRQMELSLGGLYHFGPWNESARDFERQYDCEEVWDFGALTINYPDRAIRLTPETAVQVLGETATLASVVVTPVGVTVEIRGDGLRGHHKTYDRGYCIALPEITLYGRDGEALTPDKDAAPFGVRGGSGCGGGSDKTEEGFLRIVQSYGYLLDREELDRVEVCGVTIPLS